MKQVIVFGGSGRIGKGVYKTLTNNEYFVYNADIKDNTIPGSIDKTNDPFFIHCDILNSYSVQRVFEEVLDHNDNIHAIINATYPKPQRFMKYPWYLTPDEDVDTFWRQHLTSNIMLCKFARQYEVKNVVLLSSVYGSVVPEDDMYKGTNIKKPALEYCMSKCALEYLVKYLSKDLHINAIAPEGIESDEMDQTFKDNYRKRYGKFTNVNDIAAFVEYLISDDGRGINGVVIPV